MDVFYKQKKVIENGEKILYHNFTLNSDIIFNMYKKLNE